MQDNAPAHASRSTRDWLQAHQVPLMEWPPRSPDLNPIENAWGQLARKVYENGRQFESVGQLKDAIRLAWDEIQLSELTALVNTMPKRLVEVIKKKGRRSDTLLIFAYLIIILIIFVDFIGWSYTYVTLYSVLDFRIKRIYLI